MASRIPVKTTLLHTSGRGLWTSKKAAVELIGLVVRMCEWDTDKWSMELRAEFPTVGECRWSTPMWGLIYTDPQWLKEFRACLMSLGFSRKAAYSVTYTEQGMQGRSYVSLHGGKAFITECIELGFVD